MLPEMDSDLARILERVVQPCLDELLLPGELDEVSLDWREESVRRLRDGVPRVPGINRIQPGDVEEYLERRLVLVVTVKGETFRQVLASPDSQLAPDAELHERVYDTLQDFISESRFGWGEWRGRK
jgi:hypothetical protein